MKALGLALLCAAVAGCVTPQPRHWYKDNGSEDQFAHDRLQCREFALQKAKYVNGNNPFGALFLGADEDQCLRDLGWRLEVAQ